VNSVTERRGLSMMKYIQYITQSCRKEKKTMSINHTATISINYTTVGLFRRDMTGRAAAF
jgi:hypothetical protein